ncbi:MAG: 1-phosphofructokinase family hexose kinase [Chloroflexi bacterium]|nr:1-phosphofructokinase family hexose kinase [Chloroflexota bacterium]MCY3584049.1 1-phosphofructokinase family hexose kinase [Chloroflexota bacterium]MCY3716121.1 1-phosphofructokinase family hexose kinase [Chloroflexota bacterium]MDE2649652.1 1-phosphofructokinase family hexose kinase [Chloroflexota bacterium]MXV92211.1 1-phosphofructokinase family hexose kinase [Chloroflexota bacterium]
MRTIVTLTMNPALDVATSIHSVAPEIKLRCAAPSFHPGGGGINVARAVHFLGGEACAVYAAGGHTGEKLRQLLTDEGIDQRALPIAGTTRESFTCYEASTGLQYRYTLPGPALSQPEWIACLDTCLGLQPDYLVLSGSLPKGMPSDFYGQLASRAQHSRLIIDSAGEALQAAGEAGLFLLKPNLRELERLAGAALTDEAQIQQAAQRLIDSGLTQALLISLGAAGAALATCAKYVRLRAPIVPIRSKVGAGDSMVGGLALALAQGRSLLDAARFGVAAGSAAVMTPGTQLCRRDDAERLLPQVTTQQQSN